MDVTLTGHELLDREGAPVGKVTDVISDPATMRAEWAVVKTGRFGGEHLVPLDAIEERGDLLVLPFTKDDVKDTPSVKDHTPPSRHDADELHRHYESSAS
jgi:hypothetical protein